ncbi:unnamed protein product [Meganyctiphanes norvegica]|uniref:CHK kinase-like domain-containing protein n=1 Tax=Meganyctiphanes norvegica TaxID=48144 RepID=A0AAV2RQS1_MEGNR
MKAPAKASDISKEWIQYMLTDYERKEASGTSVTVNSFETGEGSKVGDGFVGAIIKLHVNATLINYSIHSNPENKEYDLVIKLKGEDPRTGFLFENAQVYLKEMQMYSKVLVEFDNFQKNRANNQYPIYSPKFIYGKCTDEEFVLVMENMKGKGFGVHKKEETFNFEHLKLAITQLVRLHAVSYSYNQSSSFLQRHSEFKKSDYGTYFLRFASPALFDVVYEILKKEKDDELAQKIKLNKNNLVKQCEEMHNENDYKLLCLVHADAHAMNMMFRYTDGDENCRNPNDIKLFDWQLCHWNTPVVDLQYLIYSTTSREFRKEHLEDILKFYHSTFVEATINMRIEGLEWTYEDFKKDFNRMALFGLIRGIHLSFGHHCPEIAQQYEKEKQEALNQSNFMKTLQAPLVKLSQKYFFSSAMDSVMNFAMKRQFLPHLKQITNRENENLASRVLGLIYEAEENGLFG